MRRFIPILSIVALLVVCAKKTLPEGNVKGLARFQLGGGAAISSSGSDEYNPYVLQTGDNYLVLVFGSNRGCSGCSGHNLFLARSVSPYNNDAVFPAFETPAVMTVTAAPLNYANPIAFAATLAGNNVRIFLTNAGGTVQRTANILPAGSYDTTLTTIANTAGQISTVIGVEFTGDKLYARQNGTLYSFNHASAGDPLVAMATGQTATSLASVDGAFTSRYDGFFSLIDGTIVGMSLYGMGGNVERVNTAIAKARLSTRFISVLRGGGFNGGLMFISGVESGGTTQDLYVVDGMNVWQMWQELNPKPPGASGTSTPAATATADPAFSPAAGHYGMPISVTLSSTTSGAVICYTTDGVTDPVCNATPSCTIGSTYSSAVSVTYTTTNFRARACKAGLADSAVVAATHVSDGTQPTTPGSPNADGTSSSQVQVQWAQSTDNATAQAQIVYEICQTTTNGGCNTFTATFTSTAGATSYYSNGLSAATTYYYRVRSRDLAGNTSGYTAQLSATTSTLGTVAAPAFSPTAGTYASAQNVTITTTTPSATLCYSTDGSTPACDAAANCTTGSTYAAAVNIAASLTLRAIGCRVGYTTSSQTTGTYTIGSAPPATTATRVYGQLGSFTSATANNGGLSNNSLQNPAAVALDASGVYIADRQNNRVMYYAGTSTTASRQYGPGSGVNATSLNNPRGVAADASGVYIADTVYNRVLYYSGTSTTATRVYGQPDFAGFLANNGGRSATTLSNPHSVAVDASGVYIADTSNHRVLFYSGTSTTATRVYGQAGNFTTGTANNGGTSANSLANPIAVAVDATGVYIAESANNRVLFYAGTSTTATRVYGQAGAFNANTTNNGGISANSLNFTSGVCLGSDGVFVMDTGNNRGLFFSGTSTTATIVWGQASYAANTANSGGLGAGSLNNPFGCAVDSTGLYVADILNHRVLFFSR